MFMNSLFMIYLFNRAVVSESAQVLYELRYSEVSCLSELRVL